MLCFYCITAATALPRILDHIFSEGFFFRKYSAFTFTITLLCLNPLHVSGVKGPSSGGITLAVFGVIVMPPEDGRLTRETCRGLRHNKVTVKVKVY
jgi:hypothetical protein